MARPSIRRAVAESGAQVGARWPYVPGGQIVLIIEGFGLRCFARDQRNIGRRQRCARVAEAVGDWITAVAAEILQRYLHAGRRLTSLVFGDVEHTLHPP